MGQEIFLLLLIKKKGKKNSGKKKKKSPEDIEFEKTSFPTYIQLLKSTRANFELS